MSILDKIDDGKSLDIANTFVSYHELLKEVTKEQAAIGISTK